MSLLEGAPSRGGSSIPGLDLTKRSGPAVTATLARPDLTGHLLRGLGPVSLPTSLGQAPGGLGHDKEEGGPLQEGLQDSLESSVAGPMPRGGGAPHMRGKDARCAPSPWLQVTAEASPERKDRRRHHL